MQHGNASREATDNYVVRPLTGRQKWALYVLLDDGTEDRLGLYSKPSTAMTTGRMLAGWRGSCKTARAA